MLCIPFLRLRTLGLVYKVSFECNRSVAHGHLQIYRSIKSASRGSILTHFPWYQSSQSPSHPIIHVWLSGRRQIQKIAFSSKLSESSFSWAVGGLGPFFFFFCGFFFSSGAGDPAIETEFCFLAGVLLARETGVFERRPSRLSASGSFTLRFLAAGFFAVPFLLVFVVGFLFAGLTEFAGEDRSDDDALDVSPCLRFATVLDVA